jgi:hypothetical protein
MTAFEITLISKSIRIVRNVIALTSWQATRIGIAMMPETSEPLAIICKPVTPGRRNATA